MADYARQIATAARMIAQKGMPVTVMRVTEGTTYDPETDSYAPAVTAYQTYGVRSTAGMQEVQGYGFSAGSVTLMLPADVVQQIDTTDYVLFAGHRWDIVGVAVTAPAEENILFILELHDAGEVAS